MKTTITIFLLLIARLLNAQQEQLSAFKNLCGSSWISEGMQLGGFEGKSVYEMEWGLDGKIVKLKTFATDPKTKEFGLRNEGVRVFDAASKQLVFFEFDKLGGITTGMVLIEENNIHYEYEYQGMLLRDSWIYISENEYSYIVGIWKDGAWMRKFHEATLKRM